VRIVQVSPGAAAEQRATGRAPGVGLVAAPMNRTLPAHLPATRAGSLRRFARMVLLAVGYFLAAKLGLMLAIVHASATAVWPPTGIALAGLLLLGARAWPAVAIAAFLANITTLGSVASCLGIAAGNTLEALVGAELVRRFANGSEAFDRALDTFRFVLFAGVVSTMISPTIGVTSLALGGYAPWPDVGSIWLTWWLGDLGGALVVAPVIVLWAVDRSVHWSRARAWEAGMLLVVLVVVSAAVFGRVPAAGVAGQPLKFLCIPLLTLVAYRFDPRTAATAVLVVGVVAVSALLRAGLATQRGELNWSLLVLQVFLAVSATGTLALAAIVSERARADVSARASEASLREAISELEAFSHAISHDLRSPIAAVFNYAAVLEEEAGARLDPESLRLLRRLRGSAAAASQLLDQLVKYVWAGSVFGEKVPLDMSALAREACAEVTVGMEDGAAVQFEVQELPPTRGRAQLLARVLHNLLSNAVKFTRGRDPRRVVVSGRVEERENVYSVSDNGVGFDPALGEAVFQPFRQLAAGKEQAGTGLGLAIAARIVRRHGGRVGAESDGVNGALFWFTLPREDVS
jgi:signal transduction histidine kinase